jgi:O6-methylguanine-DNA--protein-cysteine methyltransferase
MDLTVKNEILKHIKLMLQEIVDSPRWIDVNNPLRERISDIGERVKSSENLREFREIEDLNLLIEIADSFEEYFNDDWLPYEIIGLKLMDSRKFLQKLIDEYEKIPDGQWTKTIQDLHERIKTHYNNV